MFIELVRRGYSTDKTIFYYWTRNDKEVDFILREETHIKYLIQVCYDISNTRTEKREVKALIECANELKCNNLVIITHDQKYTIEKEGYKIRVVPFKSF